jgi:hypothetical protein
MVVGVPLTDNANDSFAQRRSSTFESRTLEGKAVDASNVRTLIIGIDAPTQVVQAKERQNTKVRSHTKIHGCAAQVAKPLRRRPRTQRRTSVVPI